MPRPGTARDSPLQLTVPLRAVTDTQSQCRRLLKMTAVLPFTSGAAQTLTAFVIDNHLHLGFGGQDWPEKGLDK